MCDTLIATPDVTKTQIALFAKNSDRPPNEAQFLDWAPAQTYPPGESLQCTYIDIPQVQQTYAVLLSRPFWMWGAEMGINQHGVVIGNEAVFSKIQANKEPALLGMDLLRLGLERARTAVQAVDVIVELLEEYGQGGNCVQEGHLYYHNSFLISDPVESWVLETVDKHWFARQVNPIYSISNLLSLENNWDRSSAGLEEFMLDKGLTRDKDQFNLTGDFSDLIYTTFADGKSRCARSRDLMNQESGEITVQTMAAILRDHGGDPDPTPGLAGAIFKPVWVDAPPALGSLPTSKFDSETIFWAHEKLHREVLKNYPARAAVFQAERDALEAEFIEGAQALRDGSVEERKAYSETCFQKAADVEKGWQKQVIKIPVKQRFLHSQAWKVFNKKADYV